LGRTIIIMKAFIKEVLTCNNGHKSSKRLAGLLLILSGLSAKLCLIATGALIRYEIKFTLYDKIDMSTNWLIITGAGLLGLGVAELLKKKDDK